MSAGHKQCRMCGTKVVGMYVSLMGAYDKRRSLCAVLQHFTGIEVSEEDDHSTMICLKCLSKLENAEKMRINVIQTQEKVFGVEITENIQQTNAPAKKKKKTTNNAEILIQCRQCQENFKLQLYAKHVCNAKLCFQCRSKFSCKCQDENKRRKVGKPKKRVPVICHHCELDFEDAEELTSHLWDIARSKIFSCSSCATFFDSHEELQDHVEKNHKNKKEILVPSLDSMQGFEKEEEKTLSTM